MGSFEVILNRRQVLEHWHVELMSIGVPIRWQESQVDRIPMKRVTCGRTARLELLPFIDKNISSEGDLWTPVLSVFVCAFPGGHVILRSSQASSRISGVFDRKKVEVSSIGQMKNCDPPSFLVEVVVPDLPRASLVNCRQLDQIDGGTWCDRIVDVGTSQLSQSVIFLKLDHGVLGSNWGTLVPLVPDLSGTSNASKFVSSKEQVPVIREKGSSVSE